MVRIRRKNCLLIAGVILLLLLLVIAVAILPDLLDGETAQNSIGTRQFETGITLQSQPIIPQPAPLLFYENVSDGGSRTVNCYPSLPPTSTYTFWNVDRQNPEESLQPYIHAYNRDFFSAGETVRVTVYRPDGSIHLRQMVTAPVQPLEEDCELDERAVGLSWAFLPDDLAGEWQVEFVGSGDREITYVTQLQTHPEAWISRYCTNSNYTLFLDGF